jgi:methylated-DNA-[protein]-cysteine S-methyltransferase
MINLTASQVHDDDTWYGIAWAGDDMVASTVGSTRERALAGLRRCIPSGKTARVAKVQPKFVREALEMLGRLEHGQEEGKRFSLSAEYVSEPLRRILTVAAAIPIGYVTTYGNIAKVAGSEARAVGRAMSTNPLYPIVPCHRVVGSDMTLVGYGGKQDHEALAAKLARIRAEARGNRHEREVTTSRGNLTVYPAEWVLEKTRADEERRLENARKRARREAVERLQLRLF